jgi:hypothetical protein
MSFHILYFSEYDKIVFGLCTVMKVYWGSGGQDLHTLNSTEVTSQLLSNSYVITRKVRLLSASLMECLTYTIKKPRSLCSHYVTEVNKHIMILTRFASF